MRIDQEAFSVEEGNRLYRKLSKLLVDEYHAKPIDDLTTIGWNGDIKVPVHGTPLAVVISLDRKKEGKKNTPTVIWIDRRWDSAKIKVGRKRWQKLTWEDGEWAFDELRLFGKINQEILKAKGEYVAQNAEKLEMEENRSAIASACGMDESLMEMRTPFVAKINMGWGYMVIGYDPEKPAEATFREIHISRHKDFRLSWTNLGRIVVTIDSILGDKNE